MLRVITFSFERWKNYAFNWCAKRRHRQQHVANKTSGKVCHRNDARTSNEIVAQIFSLALFYLCVSHDRWYVQRNRNADLLFWAKKRRHWRTQRTRNTRRIQLTTSWVYFSRMRFNFQRKKNTINFTRFTTNVRIKRTKNKIEFEMKKWIWRKKSCAREFVSLCEIHRAIKRTICNICVRRVVVLLSSTSNVVVVIVAWISRLWREKSDGERKRGRFGGREKSKQIGNENFECWTYCLYLFWNLFVHIRCPTDTPRWRQHTVWCWTV